jgi:lysozyme family protein
MAYTDIFTRCIEIILRNEGGLVDHPSDPGGLTNFGIAKKFYPDLDIKNLTRNQAIEIYFRDYWSKMNLHDIYDENLILQIFDMGVNAGIRTAIKMVQKIVDAGVDGIIGDETTELINDYPEDLVDIYKQERKKYYFGLARRKPALQVFLKGWIHRVDNTYFLVLT